MEKENRPNAPLAEQAQDGWSTSSLPQQVLRNDPSGSAVPRHPRSARFTPIEGAVLYQKRIDNGGVCYRRDPRDRDALRRQVNLHSGEHRMVTRSSRSQAVAGIYRLMIRRVVRPSAAEVDLNPPSRSARLWAVCRTGIHL